ncbi:hypothetical protein [Desulfosudis oleivorans]|uniref:Uncharacterized protein n=1 Tax=Desulfosudis oleivorans (strain DSM 6200 / JCM 39069 / Hxd3) TaxID=96561 RepID=A8ZY38_DESOH|nr:hypothetical protein [Desulfosudis oleivorans]ABW67045.1 hypothetical protein Dole_1239 [Desulfosudis oleivorans Hxd3]
MRMLRLLIFTGVGAMLLAALPGFADEEGRQARCANIVSMRMMESLYQSRQADTTAVTGDRGNNRLLQTLSSISLFDETRVLPFKDSETTARQIDDLSRRLDKTEAGEVSQELRFNIAYEYLLLYLSLLHERNVLQFHTDTHTMREVAVRQLITSDELVQHLLQSRLYLNSLGSGARSEYSDPYGPQQAGGTSYRIRRPDADLYLSVEFLGLMVECEKLAGQFMLGLSGGAGSYFGAEVADMETIRYYDQRTWDWLNELWKRHSLSSGAAPGTSTGTGAFPSTAMLETLYRTYLSYHFLWRYITADQEQSLFLDTLTRVLFERLNSLGKNTDYAYRVTYAHYREESSRDGGSSRFLPALFFARRGCFMARHLKEEVEPRRLFELYGDFFTTASDAVQHNISYRARIYNELVLFGIYLNDLQLMEETLFPYALSAMRISGQDPYDGTEFARSSRLTAAYLLAMILDGKNRSGLHQGTVRYSDLADSLAPLLVSRDHDNWVYAAVTHKALADFYSRQGDYFNEAMAMYHARQAFLVPCEKVELTYGKAGWERFFTLPDRDLALSCLNLFLHFHDKYPTNPDAAIPKVFNAHRIVAQESGRVVR